MKKQTDRRKYPRFKVRDSLAAIIQNDRSKLGIVTDISQGGLAFRYVDSDDHEIDLNKQVKLALILPLAGNSIWHDVPCEIIKDDHSPPEYSFSSLPMRKCHVQFVDVALDQLSQLEDFIVKDTLKSGVHFPALSIEQH